MNAWKTISGILIGTAWIFVFIGVFDAVSLFKQVLDTTTLSAPQQAAACALVLCHVCVPYVFARAVSEVLRLKLGD